MTPVIAVVITTFNRVDALRQTLERLERQGVAEPFEVMVVDDGSMDGTPEFLEGYSGPLGLRSFRQPENRGIAAGRNVALREVRADFVLCLSDDVLVEPDFIERHLTTLREHKEAWVVGSFVQLGDLTSTPFGRYLDRLEQSFTRARLVEPGSEGVREMSYPTARNLSLPRVHLDRIGLFDERFRNSCEDQDLAERAMAIGVRFLYDDRIRCVHNDQVGDLDRFCRQQYWFAHDGSMFCRKWPEKHGRSPLEAANGLPLPGEPVRSRLRKAMKRSLSVPAVLIAIRRLIALLERVGAPDPVLARFYRLLSGLHIFRGWRAGTRAAMLTSP